MIPPSGGTACAGILLNSSIASKYLGNGFFIAKMVLIGVADRHFGALVH
jgi:hypothetical protein